MDAYFEHSFSAYPNVRPEVPISALQLSGRVTLRPHCSHATLVPARQVPIFVPAQVPGAFEMGVGLIQPPLLHPGMYYGPPPPYGTHHDFAASAVPAPGNGAFMSPMVAYPPAQHMQGPLGSDGQGSLVPSLLCPSYAEHVPMNDHHSDTDPSVYEGQFDGRSTAFNIEANAVAEPPSPRPKKAKKIAPIPCKLKGFLGCNKTFKSTRMHDRHLVTHFPRTFHCPADCSGKSSHHRGDALQRHILKSSSCCEYACEWFLNLEQRAHNAEFSTHLSEGLHVAAGLTDREKQVSLEKTLERYFEMRPKSMAHFRFRPNYWPSILFYTRPFKGYDEQGPDQPWQDVLRRFVGSGRKR